MLKNKFPSVNFILASGSPRRRELLNEIGLNFEVKPSNYDENLNYSDFQSLSDFVEEMAFLKARDVFSRLPHKKNTVVIAADTVVAFKNKIYGKPKDSIEAVQTLNTLSGQIHEVCTGVVLMSEEKTRRFSNITKIYMKSLDENIINDYVNTGEPLDKAGSYGIQGQGRSLIEKIEGDFENVVGLPVNDMCHELNSFFSS